MEGPPEATVMKVLIVDDSKLAGRHLAEMFAEFPEIEPLGQVGDGLQAVDCIKTLKPDVVILEVNLLAQNGFEILKHVKREKLVSIVMVLTATPFRECRESCPEMMADFFFDKSVGFSRVRQTFKQLIEKRALSIH